MNSIKSHFRIDHSFSKRTAVAVLLFGVSMNVIGTRKLQIFVDADAIVDRYSTDSGWGCDSRIVYGFPFRFLDRDKQLPFGVGFGQSLISNFMLTSDVTRFRPWRLLFNTMGWLAFGVMIAVFRSKYQMERSRRGLLSVLKLYLADAFVLFALVSCVMAALVHQAAQHEAEQWVASAVTQQDQYASFQSTGLLPFGGLGDRAAFLDRIDEAHLSFESLAKAKPLRRLKILHLYGNSDQESWRELENLAAAHSLQRLEVLNLAYANDGEVETLAIPKLRSLRIIDVCASKDRFIGFANLPNLEFLELSDTATDDTIIDELRGLKRLKFVNLHSTEVSAEGFQELRACLPDDCKIIWSTGDGF